MKKRTQTTTYRRKYREPDFIKWKKTPRLRPKEPEMEEVH